MCLFDYQRNLYFTRDKKLIVDIMCRLDTERKKRKMQVACGCLHFKAVVMYDKDMNQFVTFYIKLHATSSHVNNSYSSRTTNQVLIFLFKSKGTKLDGFEFLCFLQLLMFLL